MAKANITITIEADILRKLDAMVDRKVFQNRSSVIQKAIDEKLSRMNRNRLARECAKLDPVFEKALAEEWIQSELPEC